jgi:hypothetical protein
MKFMLPLSPYPHVYLIVKLFQINLTFIRLEDCSIFIGFFIGTPHLLCEFQISLLLTQYYNKTNDLLHTMNFGVYFYPEPFRDFSPLITPLRF